MALTSYTNIKNLIGQSYEIKDINNYKYSKVIGNNIIMTNLREQTYFVKIFKGIREAVWEILVGMRFSIFENGEWIMIALLNL